MTNLRQAAQQALEALEKVKTDADKQPPVYPWDIWRMWVDRAITNLRAALAEPQTTHWEGCEAVHPECKTEHEVKDLSNYEFKTYKTGGAELEAGFYSTDELRDLVKALDKMNAATERSMKRMK